MMKILFLVGFAWAVSMSHLPHMLVICFLFVSFIAELATVVSYSVSNFFIFDSLSVVLVLLSAWITALMLIVSTNTCGYVTTDIYRSLIIFLGLVLVLAFTVSGLIFFYIFFEVSLLPIVFLMIGWGNSAERLQACFYLMMYTVSASLPLLASICFFYFLNGHISFYLYSWLSFWGPMSELWWGFFILAFLVKTPIYFFHLWLPKAHVESPVTGSMILAGVLLKLGGYGLIRAVAIFPEIAFGSFGYLVTIVSVWGGVVCALICLRQVDIKSLIAYSSITHMGVMVGGLLSGSNLGYYGAVITMLAHGLVSSSMFLGANLMYKVVRSRSLYLIKGFMGLYPSVSIMWFFSLAANMGAPPTINLVGEIMLAAGVLKMSFFFFWALAFSLFFSAAYSLFLYVSTQNGGYIGACDFHINAGDYVCMFLHLFPVYVILLGSGVMVTIV